jgi:hypothetical protein
MPTPTTYYIDAATFDTATAVYTDAALTTKAADGYYQNCGVYRQQTSGILGPVIVCPLCGKAACDTDPTDGWTTAYQGVYEFEIDLGTSTSVNWRVKLTPGNIPNGIFVTFNGVTYSAGSSTVYGWLDGPYYGRNTEISSYDFPNASPYSVNEMEWDGQSVGGVGTTFVATSTTESVAVVPADISGTVLDPGVINIFIPKVAAEPSTATVKIIGPVGGANDSFSLSNECPVALTSFSVSARYGNASDACAGAVPNSFYNGPVTGTAGEPALHDMMFTDVTGSTTLASSLGAGFYGYTSAAVATGYFEIDANSVITSIGTCPP